MTRNTFHHGDCLALMRSMPDASVDLVLGSPPYEAQRTYGIGFNLQGQAWVDWMVERWREMQRISRGAVVMVVEGRTSKYRYSATPLLLAADLHRAGFNLRKPPIFHRVGIPGSGGPDWLRNDYEFCICTTAPGKLAWSDNTACGHPPKWAPGGEMSNRHADGRRINLAKRGPWGEAGGESGMEGRNADGSHKTRSARDAFGMTKSSTRRRTGHGRREACTFGRDADGDRAPTPSQTQRANGEDGSGSYSPPVLANPGNVIKCKVGGGQMGHDLAHENEAPYPEQLAAFFVRSFCPPGGVVFDPFCGSGTTAAVALKHGRDFITCDVRASQIRLARCRIASVRGWLAAQQTREGAGE